MAARAVPWRAKAPTMVFSSTVMLSNERTTWKVRATPARAQATGPMPLIRRPSSRTSPRSGETSPPMELNREVLPAPFGPIRPRISPRATLNDTSTLAATPPKVLLTPSTSRKAVTRRPA